MDSKRDKKPEKAMELDKINPHETPKNGKQFNNRELGNFGENEACRYLERRGYLILDRNFRVGRLGELDIIASNQETLCFIEVKTRKNLRFGTPAEAVTARKVRVIRMLSQIYLQKHKMHDTHIRFDILEIYISTSRTSPLIKRMNHIENAF